MIEPTIRNPDFLKEFFWLSSLKILSAMLKAKKISRGIVGGYSTKLSWKFPFISAITAR